MRKNKQRNMLLGDYKSERFIRSNLNMDELKGV